jgi:hypothetical protein
MARGFGQKQEIISNNKTNTYPQSLSSLQNPAISTSNLSSGQGKAADVPIQAPKRGVFGIKRFQVINTYFL